MRATERRRAAILSLIAQREIRTQEELADALAAHGFEVSQASVSRDIAALGLVKLDGRYVRPAASRPAKDPLSERIRESVFGVAPAGDHLVVLRCPPGEASAVAIAIDQSNVPGLVGTIAGDDTIFLAMDDADASRTFVARVRRLTERRPAARS